MHPRCKFHLLQRVQRQQHHLAYSQASGKVLLSLDPMHNGSFHFLSRISTLTCDIDIAILSVRDVPVLDMVQMSHFCQQWRLKPSASKTISSVFHLHNTSATRGLSVYLVSQRLRHECHPTYLGVTLDRTLSYREH